MYEFEGNKYSLEQLQDYASQNNFNFDDFMQQASNQGMVKLPEGPTAGDYLVDFFTSIPQAGLRTLGGIVNNLEAVERLILDYELNAQGFSEEEKAERI